MSNDSLSVSNHNWELYPVDSTQEMLVVPDGKSVIIGRQNSCDLTIADPYISRQHASLEVREGGLYLKDLDSSQGTFVNDARISETQVSHGDVIRLEKFRFTVRQLDYMEAAGAADAGGATIIRKLTDPAAAGTIVVKGVQPPSAKKPADVAALTPSPAPESTHAAPADQQAPQAASIEDKPKQDAPSVPPAATKPDKPAAQGEVDEVVAAAKGNWWEQQQEGPKGTEFFKVGDLATEGVSAPRVDIVADGPMLVGLSGVCLGQEFRLQSGKFILGKGDSADIHIADATVSDVHAQVIGDGISWQVVNLLSSNGTFVNEKKVRTAFLSPGDVIRIGGIELQFIDNASPGRSAVRSGNRSPSRVVVLAALLVMALTAGLFALSYFGVI